MKIPKDLNAREFIKILEKLDYYPTRQTGSHIRLSNNFDPQHHITIPNHRPLKIGTLNSILKELSQVRSVDKSEIIKQLFL